MAERSTDPAVVLEHTRRRLDAMGTSVYAAPASAIRQLTS